MSFTILQPARIVFGRGTAATAATMITEFGLQGVLVHGADAQRAGWLAEDLNAAGCRVTAVSCGREPELEMLDAALGRLRGGDFAWVAALGGGAVMDFGKALAALIPAPGGPLDHLEVVGRGLPLVAAPLPFIALPTTSGTGAEATKNAVIGVPGQGRKVSLRDDRMLARLAIVDPALTDNCPRAVTLASGLDAVTQVIEPYISCKANPFTDALTHPAIGRGLGALCQLMRAEDAQARDDLAFCSLSGGIALANSGLGAVHGLAGVIGGVTGAAHGAVCGTLLGPVLAMNRRRAPSPRISETCRIIAGILGGTGDDAPRTLASWARDAGLPGLTALGLDPGQHEAVALASAASSSMKGNPVALPPEDLMEVLQAAG